MLKMAPFGFSIPCPDGGTGRRAGLKIRFSQESGSSTLPLGTIITPLGPHVVTRKSGPSRGKYAP